MERAQFLIRITSEHLDTARRYSVGCFERLPEIRSWAIRAGLLAGLSLVAACTCAFGSTGSLGGVVKDSAGRPVGGVAVSASEGAAIQTATSLPDGAFQIANLSPGTWTVTASAAGYNSWSGDSNVSAGSSTPVNPVITPAAFSPIRINAGGPSLTDASGNVWSMDYGYVAGQTYGITTPVAATATPQLYQSERFNTGTLEYIFAVPNGSYAITLKFSENWFDSAGQRSFNVVLNGAQVAANFDICAKAGGPHVAIDETWSITVTNNVIDIQLTPVIANPKVNAIQITLPATPPAQTFSTIRVSAGGEAYTDDQGQLWSADWGWTNGAGYVAPVATILGSLDPALYRTDRYCNGCSLVYGFSVPNGTYAVTLGFADIDSSALGRCVFNVVINGETYETNFDIVQAAGGPDIAVTRTYNVVATNGLVTIRLDPVVSNPKVSTIQIAVAAPSGPEPSGTTPSTGTGTSGAGGVGTVGIPGQQAPIVHYLTMNEDLQTVMDAYSAPATTANVTIVVPVSYVYSKQITLRNRATSNWITVQSAHSFDPLVRVMPSDAANMPKIIAPGTDPAILTDQTPGSTGNHPGAAHHYLFSGLEVTTTGYQTWNLILIGTTKETDVADLPHDIYITNSYIHGSADGLTVRGIMLDGGNLYVGSSYISNFASYSNEANAIGAFNITSNLQVVNNYLEAAAENFILCGDGESIQNLVPQNILVSHNYFDKQLTWRAQPGQSQLFVKNLLEFKNGVNITVDSNVLYHDWQQQQDGTAVLFTPRTQYGVNYLNNVSNVTFTNNIVRHAREGVVIAAYDDQSGSVPASMMIRSHDYTIRNNLFDDLSANEYAPGMFANCIMFSGPPVALDIEHNTCQYATGESRVPTGLYLIGMTDLWGTTIANNNFNTDIAGDGRYGPEIVTKPADPTWWQYSIQSQLTTPPVLSVSNGIVENDPNWQLKWQQALPGIVFGGSPGIGANLSQLQALESEVIAGIYSSASAGSAATSAVVNLEATDGSGAASPTAVSTTSAGPSTATGPAAPAASSAGPSTATSPAAPAASSAGPSTAASPAAPAASSAGPSTAASPAAPAASSAGPSAVTSPTAPAASSPGGSATSSPAATGTSSQGVATVPGSAPGTSSPGASSPGASAGSSTSAASASGPPPPSPLSPRFVKGAGAQPAKPVRVRKPNQDTAAL